MCYISRRYLIMLVKENLFVFTVTSFLYRILIKPKEIYLYKYFSILIFSQTFGLWKNNFVFSQDAILTFGH